MQDDLEGLFVVSLEQAVAAPYLSGRLAEAGARVIKVEREEGDFARNYDQLVHGESAYFVWLNRGKESVILDLRKESDKAVMERMLQVADVFIQNLAPGAITRLGFDPARLRAMNERLITVSISGYGDEGDFADRKAYDLLIQAESGLSAITGNAEGSARVGVSVCDIACGMTAHQSVLQALYARSRTGKGRHISVSLFHALTDWMNVPYLQFAYGGKSPDRNGLSHPTIAPYGAYSCADGKQVLFSIQNEREWLRFCEQMLGDAGIAHDPRYADNSARVANRAALDGLIEQAFSAIPRDRVAQMLEDAGIANGRVNTMEDLAHHPQNRFVEVATPTGPVRLLAPGAVVDGELPSFGPVPALDADGDRVRREFGAAHG
ncbi:CaiB/BaiF CoA transferase family protein [Pseudooceanicola spongiae]|uniref:CoA transferase n=1 Tax=Pseudooceanicola spongiae TaxID=2613965 RepID=A0A7L9WQT6_9RHOB|nr:CaiB/BaiF CoA-transferase family protein [Pseudooceanicola spongiae]QOL82681.1 CoA transferase [Pseudooceanicola spongiae]